MKFYEVKSHLPQGLIDVEALRGELPLTADLTEFAVFECFEYLGYFEEFEALEDSAGSAASVKAQRQVLPQAAVTEAAAALESAAAQVFARGEPLGARYRFRSALQAVRQVRFLRHCSRSDECRLYFDFYYFRSLDSPFCRLLATQIF